LAHEKRLNEEKENRERKLTKRATSGKIFIGGINDLIYRPVWEDQQNRKISSDKKGSVATILLGPLMHINT
jgi:hypothetical protein